MYFCILLIALLNGVLGVLNECCTKIVQVITWGRQWKTLNVGLRSDDYKLFFDHNIKVPVALKYFLFPLDVLIIYKSFQSFFVWQSLVLCVLK